MMWLIYPVFAVLAFLLAFFSIIYIIIVAITLVGALLIDRLTKNRKK